MHVRQALSQLSYISSPLSYLLKTYFTIHKTPAHLKILSFFKSHSETSIMVSNHDRKFLYCLTLITVNFYYILDPYHRQCFNCFLVHVSSLSITCSNLHLKSRDGNEFFPEHFQVLSNVFLSFRHCQSIPNLGQNPVYFSSQMSLEKRQKADLVQYKMKTCMLENDTVFPLSKIYPCT